MSQLVLSFTLETSHAGSIVYTICRISVASVMDRRSVEDRMNDPLQPSELTATLIQEPSAPHLRWGIELKVTLRAVEVRPHIPRVISRPRDVIVEEMNRFQEALKKLGKHREDVIKEMKAKEDEIAKEESDLNKAIVACGLGKGLFSASTFIGSIC